MDVRLLLRPKINVEFGSLKYRPVPPSPSYPNGFWIVTSLSLDPLLYSRAFITISIDADYEIIIPAFRHFSYAIFLLSFLSSSFMARKLLKTRWLRINIAEGRLWTNHSIWVIQFFRPVITKNLLEMKFWLPCEIQRNIICKACSNFNFFFLLVDPELPMCVADLFESSCLFMILRTSPVFNRNPTRENLQNLPKHILQLNHLIFVIRSWYVVLVLAQWPCKRPCLLTCWVPWSSNMMLNCVAGKLSLALPL